MAEAEAYFRKGAELAPASPLPQEGLGLAAAERGDHSAALDAMRQAIRLNSSNFLAYFVFARETYRQTARGDRYSKLLQPQASEVRSNLVRSISLMPDFGPSQQWLGFFEAVQGEDLPAAERHLRRAIELEPENSSYLITLARVQMRQRKPADVRRTLAPLLLPGADATLRSHAEEVLRQMAEELNRRRP